jgi:hypothetical protein
MLDGFSRTGDTNAKRVYPQWGCSDVYFGARFEPPPRCRFIATFSCKSPPRAASTPSGPCEITKKVHSILPANVLGYYVVSNRDSARPLAKHSQNYLNGGLLLLVQKTSIHSLDENSCFSISGIHCLTICVWCRCHLGKTPWLWKG